MQDYSPDAPIVNLPLRALRTRRPATLRERLGFTWARNPNYKGGRYSKLRAKRERQMTRAWAERDAVVVSLRRRIAAGDTDPRLTALVNQLAAATFESLGVETYTPRGPGGGKAAARPYISAAAEAAALAFIGAVRAAWRIFAREARHAYALGLRVLPSMLRAMQRERVTDPRSEPPHLPVGSVSLSRDRSCTSDASGQEWLRRYERHARPEADASAM